MGDNDQNEPTISFVSATSKDQTNVASKMDVMSIDMLKIPSCKDEQTAPIETTPTFSIGKIYKNLILLSAAFVLLFTAYNGIVTLQSSLNVKNNVGVNSLIITYAFLIVSSAK